MYAATLPVHIKRIKRKAVPSCLLPRLPQRVLPRLSSTLQLVVGFLADLFSQAAALVRLSDVTLVRPTCWGLLLSLTKRSTNAKNRGRKHDICAHWRCIHCSVFGAAGWYNIGVDKVQVVISRGATLLSSSWLVQIVIHHNAWWFALWRTVIVH